MTAPPASFHALGTGIQSSQLGSLSMHGAGEPLPQILEPGLAAAAAPQGSWGSRAVGRLESGGGVGMSSSWTSAVTCWLMALLTGCCDVPLERPHPEGIPACWGAWNWEGFHSTQRGGVRLSWERGVWLSLSVFPLS